MHIRETLNAINANHHYEYLVIDENLKIIEYSDRIFDLCDVEKEDCDTMTLMEVAVELYGLEYEIEKIFKDESGEFKLTFVQKAPNQYVHIHLAPGREKKMPDKNGYRYESLIVLFENVSKVAEVQQRLVQEHNEKSLLVEKIAKQNKQLQRFNEEMQLLVEEKTRKNLEQQKMVELQARYAQMGEMIGMLTHQWKQPLNVISIVNYVMKQKIMIQEWSEELFLKKIDEVDKQVRFMDQTIHDFQGFFNPHLKKTEFNVYETLSFVLDLVKYEYEFHNIKLQLEGDKSVNAVGYPNELNQVLLSLLKNAKDAFIEHPKENMQIIMLLDHYDGYARIRIRDNAGGIPYEIINKIFDLYMTTKKDGSGLGLNIAKNIVENNMNGKLTVRNAEGGAEFTILLPK